MVDCVVITLNSQFKNMDYLPPSEPDQSDPLIDQLYKLNELRKEGIISDEVFNAKKKILLHNFSSVTNNEIPPQQGTSHNYVPENQHTSGSILFPVLGFIFPFISLLMLPIIFMPLGILFGLLSMANDYEGYGILIIILTIVLGLIGVHLGGWGLGIGY